MCGIIAVTGRVNAVDALIEGLRRVEYRGYDSAGVAVHDGAKIQVVRAVGKLDNLVRRLGAEGPPGACGIGHTRWATHGAVTEANAHPHVQGRVHVVHNGVIENARRLRAEAEAAGAHLSSETDTEALAWVLDQAFAHAEDDWAALSEALARLEGAFAFAAIREDKPGLVFAARRGCPLALAETDDGVFLGSDALGLSPFADRIQFLEDGDAALLSPAGLEVRDAAGARVARRTHVVSLSPAMAEKGEHAHFMAKEIHEQPEAVARTLGPYVETATGRAHLATDALAKAEEVTFLACGTAAYAGQAAAGWFERYARIRARVETASEFRYREPYVAPGTLAFAISQSGETADTLAALDHAKAQGAATAALVNVETSTMARSVDLALTTHAGPEIGVASTKAFTCQLAALGALALGLGRSRGVLAEAEEQACVAGLLAAPRLIAEALAEEDRIATLAAEIAKTRDILVIGRGASFPLAMEGALKLKEISYIHAEGYAAGELKHGPIALVDEEVPIVVLAPSDAVFEKTFTNAQEAAARGGKVIFVSDDQGLDEASDRFWRKLRIPAASGPAASIVAAVPLQLLAYHVAVAKGTDVDRPRNLAKSVTVE